MFLKCQNRKFIIVFSVNLCFLMLSFWGFLILLFLICFFRHFIIPISADYQCITSNQQDFKNNVTVKSPWNLVVGDNCWLGEGCWIDNLDKVFIGSNVCISQGAMLLTGNHDYTLSSMPYRNAAIHIGDGAWIGAKTVVCPGVTVHDNAVLTVGSVAAKDMEADGIYQGNPAVKIRERKIKE